MKGYYDSSSKILYVFPQTAAEIPYVDPATTSIAVQQEDIADWVEENSSVADLMVTYNYNMMTVQKKVWSDHLNDDLSPVYDITLSGAQSLIQNLSLNKSKAAEDESITITPGGSSYTAQWVDVYSTDAPVTWDNTNSLWGFTMPASDVTVSAEERTLYHITKSGGLANDFTIEPSAYMPQHEYQYDSYVCLVPTDATTINPTNGYVMDITFPDGPGAHGAPSWSNENSYWYFGMYNRDVNCEMIKKELHTINYTSDYSSIISGTDVYLSAYEGEDIGYHAQSGINLYNDYDISVVGSNSNPIQLVAPTEQIPNLLQFRMPDENVYITISPKATLYDVVYGGDYSSIITNTNISSAAEGQVLVFAAQSGIDLYNDYDIKVADISDQPIPVDAPTAVNNTLTFTMPAKNAYITITEAQPEPQTSTITVVSQDTLDGQPSGDPVQLSSDSYGVGTNQVIDLGIMMLDGTYIGPTCSDETFVDWSFDPGDDEPEPINASITITSVPNEDLTFSFEHSVD